MTEELLINTLKALGAEDVTTESQRKNSTTAFKLPTGDTVSEHKTGYIRKQLMHNGRIRGCYQMNPVYHVPFKCVLHDGRLFESTRVERMRIWSRQERLQKILNYTVKQLTNN